MTSQERAEKAISSITSSSSPKNPATLKVIQLDLNDLSSVKTAATEFAQQESRLDILWNNAGLGARTVPSQAKTANGLEMFMGVHCVATLYFTQLLLPQLKTAASTAQPGSVRVVWTSSLMVETHVPKSGIDFDLLDTGVPDNAINYARSKCGAWILCNEFARRYVDTGIVSVTQNPGNLKTNMFDGVGKLLMAVLNLILHEPILGAHTELYAGLSPDIKNGAYVVPFGRVLSEDFVPRQDIAQQMKATSNGGTNLAGRFWDWCEDRIRAGEPSS